MKRDRTAVLKAVDHWIGLPLCWGLGTIATILSLGRRTVPAIPSGERPRRIVVSKFFGLGSIALSSALLRAIREHFPDVQIVFVTFESNLALMRRMPDCDTVVTVSISGPVAFLRSVVGLLWCFLRQRPDVFIDLEFYSKFSTALSFLSRARWRIAFHLPAFWRASLVNVPVYFNTARHILDIYAMVATSMGARVKDPLPSGIMVSDDERHRFDEKLRTLSLPAHGVRIGVNVNASDLALGRRWPRERFAAVIDGLLKWRDDIAVVLTGTREEAEYTGSVMDLVGGEHTGRVINLSGQLTFAEYLSLLENLDVLLTNDSGPFHLAKGVGLPTVSIWGPGDPGLYGPYGSETADHAIIYKRWPCSPCMYIYRTDAGFFCNGTMPCMDAINSDEVLQTLQIFIDNRKRERV